MCAVIWEARIVSTRPHRNGFHFRFRFDKRPIGGFVDYFNRSVSIAAS